MLQDASKYGRLYVALNSDSWLRSKKSYVFMPWRERAEILRAIHCVFHVMPVRDGDGTVIDALDTLRPHYFANGGDRTQPDEREHLFCERAGIQELFGIGGGKVQSSSALVSRAILPARDSDKNPLPGQLLRRR